jgi:serine/threonine-protein kinase
MGEVYLGFNEVLKKKVALKALRAGHRLNQAARARFLREARILSQVEHPNICRIHDYIEGDEADFLVLELIEGRSLRRAIGERLDYATRLRIAEQIANVLVAAHAAGVVHRDLKPGNVMLTSEGEVKVLDFGLARPVEVGSGELSDLDEITDPRVPIQPAAADPPEAATIDPGGDVHAPTIARAEMSLRLETRAGSLMGTPAYMSPEQARGEPASSASDMYSFGLLMQTLFTGKPPYDESTAPMELLRRAVRADTLPVTGLRADLTRLIERLKSKAPSGRPTAVDAAASLRRIREKPRRRLRRVAVAASLLALILFGVKYALDLRRERGVARQRQAQAEALLVYHLGDLRAELEPLGRLDILDGVGARALDYFESVDESLLSTDELSRYATALSQIGQVRIAQGNLDGALEAFEESLARADSLAARDPDRVAWRKILGEAHFWVGFVQWQRRDLDGALARFRVYQEIAEWLVEREPEVDAWRLEVGYNHTNIGKVLEAQGDLDGAVAEYRSALAVKQPLARANPDDLEMQHSLAVTQEDLARLFQSLGRPEAAEDHLRRGVEIKQALVDREPDNLGRLSDLGVGLNLLGTLLADKGEPEAALEQFRADLAISERLIARDRSNAIWLRGAAIGHRSVGNALRDEDPAAALEHLETARGLMRELVEKDPARVDWQRDLASVELSLAALLESLGELERARRVVAVARDALEGCHAEQPDERVTVRFLGIACHRQGRLLEKLGRQDEARMAWERALTIVEPVARDSDETGFLDLWARILLRLDRLKDAEPVVRELRALGYQDESLDELLQAKGLES